MARAARYALAQASRHARGDFAAGVLRELRTDRVGDVLAWTARTLAARVTMAGPVAALPGFALDRTLWRGGVALARHVAARGYRVGE